MPHGRLRFRLFVVPLSFVRGALSFVMSWLQTLGCLRWGVDSRFLVDFGERTCHTQPISDGRGSATNKRELTAFVNAPLSYGCSLPSNNVRNLNLERHRRLCYNLFKFQLVASQDTQCCCKKRY